MKNEKGIAMITLAIVIMILLILAAVSFGALTSQKQAKNDVVQSELKMVQNAVLQRKTTGDITQTDYAELPGTTISKDDVNEMVSEKGISLKGNDEDYKTLDENALAKLGVSNTTDEYIVNYKTGEVINKTQFDNFDEPLYIYSVSK